jgi:hypothetical protein
LPCRLTPDNTSSVVEVAPNTFVISYSDLTKNYVRVSLTSSRVC